MFEVSNGLSAIVTSDTSSSTGVQIRCNVVRIKWTI